MPAFENYKTFMPVTSASAVDDHTIRVIFANGQQGTVDFSPLIGNGPWTQLADPNFFRLAHAAYDTVIWTEDVDVAPEYIWEHAAFE